MPNSTCFDGKIIAKVQFSILGERFTTFFEHQQKVT